MRYNEYRSNLGAGKVLTFSQMLAPQRDNGYYTMSVLDLEYVPWLALWVYVKWELKRMKRRLTHQ